MMIEKSVSLKPYNTFGINVVAKEFARFSGVSELAEIFDRKYAIAPLVLGGGSNILFTKNVDGIVLKNEIKGIDVIKEHESNVYVKTGAGENWHQFVLYCLKNNYAGVENLALIPGCNGASPMQNIGAYGVEIKDVFYSLEAFDIENKRPVIFNNSDCEFGYRESVFKNKYRGRFIITSVTYKLNKKPNYNISYGAIQQELDRLNISDVTISAIAEAVIRIRKSKLPDPEVIGNAGSFFKNPEISLDQFNELKDKFPAIVGFPLDNGKVKLAAGWLIEYCGWKGYRKEDAGCHEKQALVLVNYGHATGEEIFNLSSQIQASVERSFGITLEREVNVF